MAEEFRTDVYVQCPWPRTTIATAAVESDNRTGGEALMRRSRTPEIMADAPTQLMPMPRIHRKLLAGRGCAGREGRQTSINIDTTEAKASSRISWNVRAMKLNPPQHNARHLVSLFCVLHAGDFGQRCSPGPNEVVRTAGLDLAINIVPFYTTLTGTILSLTLHRPERFECLHTRDGQRIDSRICPPARTDDGLLPSSVTGTGRAFCAEWIWVAMQCLWARQSRASLDDLHAHLEDPAISRGVPRFGRRLALRSLSATNPSLPHKWSRIGIGDHDFSVDVRLASKGPKLVSYSKVRIVNEACTSWFLPRIVGISQALELSISGHHRLSVANVRASQSCYPHVEATGTTKLLAHKSQTTNRR